MAKSFGKTPDGAEVVAVSLGSGKLSCEIISFGASIRALTVPDRDGNGVDIVLGFDACADYLAHTAHFGAVVGRCANRIGSASFDLNGVRYPLCANQGANHLHGGPTGFSRQVWTLEDASEDAVTFSLVSPDGHEGYPGTLKASATYTLTDDALRIDYRAVSDRDTICNLTNHAYFNLNGHAGGGVENQTVQIFSDAYTPTDKDSIPTGEIAPVAGTPLDLRAPQRIGAHIDDDFDQLRRSGGYDQNFVIDGEAGTLRPAAVAHAAESGITMRVETDRPGVQLYTGNGLGDTPPGKGGARYGRRSAFCLETQLFPDAPHHAGFPSAVLRAGEEWRSTTIYRFSSR